jgi:hypothetical protein
MIYKIHFTDTYDSGVSAGFDYAGSQADAIRCIKAWHVTTRGTWPTYTYQGAGVNEGERLRLEINEYPTPTTKGEWLKFLNTHGAHPDNG